LFSVYQFSLEFAPVGKKILTTKWQNCAVSTTGVLISP